VLDDVLGYLRCPHCGGALARAGPSLRCGTGHSFDIARQGYVSLLPAGTPGGGGDTAAMVRARRDFLAAGHFAPIAAAVAAAAAAAVASAAEVGAAAGGATDHAAAVGEPRQVPGCVADVGAGTGYFLAAVLDRLARHRGLALDVSRHALRVAARAHPRIGAVGCDAWRPLPVADAAADLALNVFAPRDGAELHRILRPSGCLLVVTPATGHLAELIGPLGLLSVDERKRERLAGKLGPYFDLVGEQAHGGELSLDHAAVGALAAMGPSARHAEPEVMAARIARLAEPVAVTLAVTLSVLRPRR
jgi:23S rRNA (guanine745-N1)-methyltransferase